MTVNMEVYNQVVAWWPYILVACALIFIWQNFFQFKITKTKGSCLGCRILPCDKTCSCHCHKTKEV